MLYFSFPITLFNSIFIVMNKNNVSVRNRRKPNKMFIVLLVVLIALCGYLVVDSLVGMKTYYVPYKDFYEMCENESDTLEKVTISENEITFTKKNMKDTFETENPHSPVLEEFLLKNGIEVEVEGSIYDVFSLIFDIIFYGFFIFVIVMVVKKFVSPNTFKVVHKTGVKFDDVVGMDSLKRDMVQIMNIMKNPMEYAKKGIRMPKGILLEGEPGNGKTLFAKALAGEANVNFIPTKATDFESMFMAIGPMKVKMLFKKARKRAPCIVFIDEFDGIGTVRNYSGSAIETENTRIVTALLNELDGFEQTNGVLVIAATNSIHALDPALIRPGRFDAKLSIPYPNEENRIKLVEMYSRGKSVSSECTPQALAKMFNGFSCAKIESVLNKAAMLSSIQNKNAIDLSDVKDAIKEVK